MGRRSSYSIVLTASERKELEALARRYTLPYYQVVRAKVVLLAAQGLTSTNIAKQLDLSERIVRKWRKRFWKERLKALEDQVRSGRPPVFSPGGQSASESYRLRASEEAGDSTVAV
jgi:transposase-like protein